MTFRNVILAALVAAPPLAAHAQLAPRSVALEALASAPLSHAAPASGSTALTATAWLDGNLDLVLRASTGAASRTGGRAAARWYAGTAGVRWSFAPGPVRPQLGVEGGWSRDVDGSSGAAVGVVAGLEWFPARDVALRAETALRGPLAGRGWRGDGAVALAFYF